MFLLKSWMDMESGPSNKIMFCRSRLMNPAGDRRRIRLPYQMRQCLYPESLLCLIMNGRSNKQLKTKRQQAINQMKSSKSTGLNGRRASSIENVWHLTGKKICSMIMTFLKYGHLLKESNKTNITLILKKLTIKRLMAIE